MASGPPCTYTPPYPPPLGTRSVIEPATAPAPKLVGQRPSDPISPHSRTKKVLTTPIIASPKHSKPSVDGRPSCMGTTRDDQGGVERKKKHCFSEEASSHSVHCTPLTKTRHHQVQAMHISIDFSHPHAQHSRERGTTNLSIDRVINDMRRLPWSVCLSALHCTALLSYILSLSKLETPSAIRRGY